MMTSKQQQQEQQQHSQSLSALIAALSATDAAADKSQGATWVLPGTEEAVGVEVIDNGLGAAAVLRARAADYRAKPLLVRGDPALARWPGLFEARTAPVAPAPALDDKIDEAEAEKKETYGADAASWVPSKVYRISLDPATVRFDSGEAPLLREEDIRVRCGASYLHAWSRRQRTWSSPHATYTYLCTRPHTVPSHTNRPRSYPIRTQVLPSCCAVCVWAGPEPARARGTLLRHRLPCCTPTAPWTWSACRSSSRRSNRHLSRRRRHTPLASLETS